MESTYKGQSLYFETLRQRRSVRKLEDKEARLTQFRGTKEGRKRSRESVSHHRPFFRPGERKGRSLSEISGPLVLRWLGRGWGQKQLTSQDWPVKPGTNDGVLGVVVCYVFPCSTAFSLRWMILTHTSLLSLSRFPSSFPLSFSILSPLLTESSAMISAAERHQGTTVVQEDRVSTDHLGWAAVTETIARRQAHQFHRLEVCHWLGASPSQTHSVRQCVQILVQCHFMEFFVRFLLVRRTSRSWEAGVSLAVLSNPIDLWISPWSSVHETMGCCGNFCHTSMVSDWPFQKGSHLCRASGWLTRIHRKKVLEAAFCPFVRVFPCFSVFCSTPISAVVILLCVWPLLYKKYTLHLWDSPYSSTTTSVNWAPKIRTSPPSSLKSLHEWDRSSLCSNVSVSKVTVCLSCASSDSG